jgi:hypothetical protein
MLSAVKHFCVPEKPSRFFRAAERQPSTSGGTPDATTLAAIRLDGNSPVSFLKRMKAAGNGKTNRARIRASCAAK